jgi:ABC-type sugar transport system substrate-binding protein
MRKGIGAMNDNITAEGSVLTRRRFVASSIVSLASAGLLLSGCDVTAPQASTTTVTRPKKDRYRAAFIQYLPHTVPEAWSKGLAEVFATQGNVDYELLDGQAKPDVQITLADAALSKGVDVLYLQPVDGVAIGPAIRKANEAGVPVITLNIDATEVHAVHVEMNHFFGATAIAEKMGELLGGKGKVVILNAPPGIAIRDLRTNGFVEGLKKFPDIEVIADQVAEWDRKKAHDILSTLLAANPDITGVYGVNDSMALGAVDAAKAAGKLGQMVIFGNDGEKAAIESIEAGELTGTQYTDVYQQGRFAAAVGIALASGGVAAQSFGHQGHVLMHYSIVTKDNAGSIQAFQRW